MRTSSTAPVSEATFFESGYVWYPDATACIVQGVFFNWPPPEFAKCRPVSNIFEKYVRVQDWPPLFDWKKLKC